MTRGAIARGLLALGAAALLSGAGQSAIAAGERTGEQSQAFVDAVEVDHVADEDRTVHSVRSQ